MSDEVPRGDDAFPADLAAGSGAASRIAGYRLEQRIGAGGMAVVFRARDERLGRLVALKILAPGLAADEEFRQRFIRESRAAAAVDDPHIIPVFEAGEAEGVLFIAMRYVPGGDVRSLVRREGPLSPERVAAIISPVASALDAAHAAGLVHRDVKPANMLLDTRAGRPDHVYLTDFGLSKGRASTVTLTRVGQSMGTPAYMAPEQIEGRAVDGRTDQYALACAAFELLAGQPPFERDQQGAVIYAQLSAPPPALTSWRPGLPAQVDGVLARALAKAPDNRYPNCRVFAEALRRALGLASYDRGSGAYDGGLPPIRTEGPPDRSDTTGDTPPGDADPSQGKATVTSLGQPGVSTDDVGHGARVPPPLPYPPTLPAPPGRNRRLPVLIAGIAVVVVAAVVAAITLTGSPAHKPKPRTASIVIAAQSSVTPVSGYTFVYYKGGNDSTAQISGKIKGAASGEVAQLYAQPFPYQHAPTQVGEVILHAKAKLATYSFDVTPSVATRYMVELFQSSAATRPFASSQPRTVYVARNYQFSGASHKTCSPVCQLTVRVQYSLPASAVNAEGAKKLYVYFGLNLALHKTPPDPKVLILGAGSARVTEDNVSATEFKQSVTFSFRVGDDNSEWSWNACLKDTEAEDGIGLPGNHGCGNDRISDSVSYLG